MEKSIAVFMEMNAHAAQSLQTQQELISLAAVPKQIMSPRDSTPIVSIVQDIALGVYRLTKNHTRLNEKQMFNILSPIIEGIKPLPAALEGSGSGKAMWSGRQMLSTIIPQNINIRCGNKFFDERKEDDRDNYVIIDDGEIKQGTIDKSIYQSGSKGLVHSITNEYSAEDTRNFFDNTQKLICNWLVYSGFSTGISDLVVDQGTLSKCNDIIVQMKQKVAEFITNVHKRGLDNKSTKNNADFFEEEVNNLLNRAAKQVGDLAAGQVDDKVNRMINMIKSGAKGSEINFAQMIGCLGQQNVDGTRIPYGFDDRTLPHFTKYDDGAEARGFVQNSFISGLSPQEFFFHAMGGREGLIDTAVKSVTGDTPIVIIENGKPKYVKIGDWIDAHLDANKEKVEYYPNDRNLELLKFQPDDNLVYIPTTDEDGNVTWGEVTDITRHDPGETLYKVETASGRKVTVTAGQSLLVWNKDEKKIHDVASPDVKIGDYLPVTLNLRRDLRRDEWNADEYNKAYHRTFMISDDEVRLRQMLEWAVTDTQSCITGILDALAFDEFTQTCNSYMAPSEECANLVSILYSRVGMFTTLFSTTVTRHHHDSSQVQNDVALDPVIRIEKIDGSTEKKMYDLTIPSTLNFGLANGLQVRDTSSTGYIQRQLVKAMEDCKVMHDFTVRNANNSIIQFLYGEDGMDAVKIEAQGVPYVDMTIDKLVDEFLIREKKMLKAVVRPEIYDEIDEKQLVDACLVHFDKIVADRKFMIETVNQGGNSSKISYPVNLQRMINGIQSMYASTNTRAHTLLDLNPMHIIEQIDRLCDELFVTKKTGVSRFFQMLIRTHLSPKRVLLKYKLCKAAFDLLVTQINQRFYDSIVHPGDMVGVVAAQSVGEPTTQLSNLSETRILLQNKKTGVFYNGPIGKFIDNLIEERKAKVIDIGHDSLVLDLEEDELCIIGVSNEEKTSWKPISQVSRHPAKGGMVRVHTRSKKTTCATLSHSFLKRTTNGIDPVLGSDLKVGDRIPVAKYIPEISDPVQNIKIGKKTYDATRELGWLFGVYLADGYINGNTVSISKVIPEYQDELRRIVGKLFKCEVTTIVKQGQGTLNGYDMSKYIGNDNNFLHKELASLLSLDVGNGSFNKRVPGWVFASNLEFIQGVVQGWMDGDGNVNDIIGKQMIRGHSVCEGLIDDMIILLAYSGFFASKCRETHNTVERNDLFSLQISRKYARKYKESIGFIVKEKAEALDKVIEYIEREDKHDVKEIIDMIPELGDVLASVGKALELDGQSRLYKRFQKKAAIGRQTLFKFIGVFEERYVAKINTIVDFKSTVKSQLEELNAAVAKTTAADKIVEFKGEFETLGKTIATLAKSIKKFSPYMQYGSNMERIGRDTLVKYTNALEEASIKFIEEMEKTILTVPENIAILRQAAESDVVWDEIVELEYLPDPKEYVYDFTVPGNDSFMVDTCVLVHNTLNSVEYHTDLLLKVDGKLEKVKIGEFIDNHIDNLPTDLIEKHPNDTWLGQIEKNKNVEVLSCNKDGKVIWSKVEAVTKHPVVNEDHTDTILKVNLRSGRTVTATKAKSFLKRVNNEIVQVKGSEIGVGDKLPVSRILPINQEINKFDMSKYLPMNKWLFTSQVQKALKRVKEFAWWKKYHGKEFILPYSRSDSFAETFVNGNVKQKYEDNCVYPKNANRVVAKIPEDIPLDEDFGFLVGAYLSEGHATSQHVLIANVDEDFLGRVKKFCDKYDVGFHIKTRHINNGTSTTLRMHCRVLAELFRNYFGELSQYKRAPAELLGANKTFLREVINGYFSGDGTVSNKQSEIKADSTSLQMLEFVQQILLRFDIVSTIFKHENKQDCFKSEIQQAYTLHISSGNFYKFAREFTLTLKEKQERIDDWIKTHEPMFEYSRHDNIPDVVLSTGTMDKIHRDKANELLTKTNDEGDRQVLQKILEEDIIYDEIVSIEEVKSEHPYVYDLTVEETRNFNTFTGICMADTFHSAGISSASKAVRGVPRLQELLSVTKKIKTPIMTIHVKPEYRTESKSKEEYKAKCLEVLNELSTTRFRDIVNRSRIFYDPDDYNTRIPEDKPFVGMYKVYDEMMGVAADHVSPWLLRLEFNRQKMVNIGITMIDIHNVLMDFYDERVSCMFSDDNATDLVMRIKLVSDADETGEDMLSEIKALEFNILNNVMIKGVSAIEKISMREQKSDFYSYNRETETFEAVNEWIMDTDGSNLREILVNKHVDPYLTMTNNINEIYEVLGVEAVRKALYIEIMEVLSGINVNYRHISLLIDTMTNKGMIMPINRHGINRGDAGPLAKCSFEEVTDMLVSAGVFADMDKVNGVSANVMLGQIAPCGTGDSDVVMDELVMQRIMEAATQRNNTAKEGIEQGDVDVSYNIKVSLPTPPATTHSSSDNSIATKKMSIIFT